MQQMCCVLGLIYRGIIKTFCPDEPDNKESQTLPMLENDEWNYDTNDEMDSFIDKIKGNDQSTLAKNLKIVSK